MKKNIITCILLCSSLMLHAQQKKILSKEEKAIQDSVENKYIKYGAYYHNIFTHEWQSYLDSALAITPGSARAWELKSMPYDKAGKYELGEKYLNKAVELDPYEYLDLRAFQKCIFYKRYRDALADYEKAEKMKGDFTMMEHPYSFYQGICYLGLNEFDSAMIFFDKSINTEIKDGGETHVHFMNWYYKAIVFMEKEDYPNAILYFDKVLNTYSHFSDAQYYKALCLYRLKKDGEAADLMKEAAANFKKGYSFTEDNAIYEKYPYQLRAYMMR